MIELTLQQQLELSVPEPVAIDPQTRETYVLVRREAYDRLKSLVALDDYDADEGAGYINEVMAADDAKSTSGAKEHRIACDSETPRGGARS